MGELDFGSMDNGYELKVNTGYRIQDRGEMEICNLNIWSRETFRRGNWNVFKAR